MSVTKSKKDLAASISARLLNISKASGRDHNAVLLQYFQECFLRRLSISSYNDKLVLKGGLLFWVFNMSSFRPTKDIDLQCLSASNHKETVKKMICDISHISIDDGVQFYPENLSILSITEENEYQGLRVKLEVKLGSIRKRIQIDIGFGDVVFPEPCLMKYPTLLGHASPEILMYTRVSVIAEKFHAIIRFGLMTSRMKDYYDIVFLAQTHPFHMGALGKAIRLNFRQRKTAFKTDGLFWGRLKEDSLKQQQWKSFLTRHHLNLYDQFYEVVTLLEKFIVTVCKFKQEDEENYRWNPERWGWEL